MEGRTADDDREWGGATRSHISGSAGDVVQARDVSGGIHFHGVAPHMDVVPRQLPGDVRGFVNRAVDLERLDALLDGGDGRPGAASVCVIAGTAGVGKTSLAVHWAHRVQGRFPDGQLYVNLRGYDPGEPVAPAQALERFLGALGMASDALPADLEARAALYRSLLAQRRVLVVLDNAATVGQVRPLLQGAGRCLTVVTSRSRLSSLVARDGAQRVTLEVLGEPEAVQLLRETTAGYRSGDGEGEVAELARLCARLPLALRIAAERAAARPRVPLSALIEDLRDESSLWDALSSEDDEEADAVRTVFAWSYRALPEPAARLFRLLGLHPGPQVSTHAAAALADLPQSQARRLLDVLVGAHLLEQTDTDRWQFHDLLRAYALDQTHHHDTPDGQRAALERVVTWYLYTAKAAVTALGYRSYGYTLDLDAVPALTPFTGYHEAMRWYEAERANLLGATRAAADHRLDGLAWRLSVVAGNLHTYPQHADDWIAGSEIGLAAARRAGDRSGEALVLYSLGKAHSQFHQPQQALDEHRAALAIWQQEGERRGEVESLWGMALAHLRLRSLDPARDSAEQALAIAETTGRPGLVPWARHLLGIVYSELGRLQEAEAHLAEAVAWYRAQGARVDEIDVLVDAAPLQRELGRLDEALETAQRVVAVASDLDVRVLKAMALAEEGRLHHLAGRQADALTSYHEAAALERRIGHRRQEAQALDATGLVYADLARPDDAADFHRRAAAIHRDLGDQWSTAVALDHLAAALHAVGSVQEALSARRQALTLLAAFDDPKAVSLRDSITAALTDHHDQGQTT